MCVQILYCFLVTKDLCCATPYDGCHVGVIALFSLRDKVQTCEPISQRPSKGRRYFMLAVPQNSLGPGVPVAESL